MFKFVNEIDHVLAHGGTVYPVDEPTVLVAGVLCFDLLDDLLAERTDLGRTCHCHVLR